MPVCAGTKPFGGQLEIVQALSPRWRTGQGHAQNFGGADDYPADAAPRFCL